MRALLTKILGDLRRRRLQTIIVTLIVALAVGVGTLAIALLHESSAPYTQAFDQYQGAHLTVLFRGNLVTSAQLRATTRLPEVTASAGPWQATFLSIEYGLQKTTVEAVSRSDPGGPVDRLRLVAGRWATGPGEIVLTRSFAQQIGVGVGGHVRSINTTSRPTLTVVGEVADVDEANAINFTPQFAWVAPTTMPALLPPGQSPYEVVLYRFRHATTTADLQQRIREITDITTPTAVDGSTTYLVIGQIDNLSSALTLILLLAFAAFALGAVALIVVNVVSGATLAGQRDIGIVKALGFTPGQVVSAFVGQMLAPALLGCLIGAPLGLLGSQPLLAASAEAIGLPAPVLLDVTAPFLATLGALVVVAIAAAIPAWRAGLLRPAEVIAASVTPPGRQRGWADRLFRPVRWLPLSRPVTLGAGDAFARPVRGVLTTLAVVIGVATLVFAFGLSVTFQRIGENRAQFNGADVTITRFSAYPDSALTRSLNAQPGTRRVIANDRFSTNVAQLSSPVTTVAMRGDSATVGFPMIAGRWFHGPGEAVGGPAFLKEAHLAIGDTFTATLNNHTLHLRLVGEYFEFSNFGRDLRFDWSTYLQANPHAQPSYYLVDLQPGTNATAYGQRIAATAPDYLSVTTGANNFAAPIINAIDGVLAILVAILVAIAIIGVFNTMLLNIRERIRDTATLKTLGMTPAQIIGMTLTSAVVIGVIGGAIGVPLGVWLHQALLGEFGSVAGESLPALFTQGVFNPLALSALALSGVVVAALGAVLPAWLATREPIAEVLRAE